MIKPTYKRPILAQHKWRLGADGQPIVTTFTRRVWDRLPSTLYEGTKYTNMGWKKIEEFNKPKQKVRTPPEAEEKPAVSAELEAKVKEAVEKDNQRGVTIEDIENYAAAKNFEIDTNQAKSEIFDELKEIVKSEI